MLEFEVALMLLAITLLCLLGSAVLFVFDEGKPWIRQLSMELLDCAILSLAVTVLYLVIGTWGFLFAKR